MVGERTQGLMVTPCLSILQTGVPRMGPANPQQLHPREKKGVGEFPAPAMSFPFHLPLQVMN